MISGEIKDWQLSTSSTYPSNWDRTCHERYARLYQPNGHAWCAKYKTSSEWLQIDLGVLTKVTRHCPTNSHTDGDVHVLTSVPSRDFRGPASVTFWFEAPSFSSKFLVYFLANVNSRSRSLYAVARPSVCRLSVVGNARAPYSGGSNFRQYFYGIWYPSHPLTSTENFTEIVPGEPLRRGS